MGLDKVAPGSEVCIVSIPDGPSRLQLIRMGITEGVHVRCHGRFPSGPIVLKCRHQEIAIGRRLAEEIIVR